jgi:hypothetical protein
MGGVPRWRLRRRSQTPRSRQSGGGRMGRHNDPGRSSLSESIAVAESVDGGACPLHPVAASSKIARPYLGTRGLLGERSVTATPVALIRPTVAPVLAPTRLFVPEVTRRVQRTC